MSSIPHPPLVEALLKAETYPAGVAAVELVESPISDLILTGATCR